MHEPLPAEQSPAQEPSIRGRSIIERLDSLPTERTLYEAPRTQLTVAETARLLGVSVRVIHLRIKAGLLPAVKLPGATSPYLIDSAVADYMAIQEADRRARREARIARRAARAASTAA